MAEMLSTVERRRRGGVQYDDYEGLRKELIDRTSWDEYIGWERDPTSRETPREAIISLLLPFLGDTHAKTLTSALLLHGIKGKNFLDDLNELRRNQRLDENSLFEFLTRNRLYNNILIYDDKALGIFSFLEEEQDRVSFRRESEYFRPDPTFMEQTAFQMIHAIGSGDIFGKGKAKALLRNVAVEYRDDDGKKLFESQERVDADHIMEWGMDMARRERGNHTRKEDIAFESAIVIYKPPLMGASIDVLQLQKARKSGTNMLKSKYEFKADGTPRDFDELADRLEALYVLLDMLDNGGIGERLRMRNREKLLEFHRALRNKDNLARNVGNYPMPQHLSRLSERGNGTKDADGKFGDAVFTSFLAMSRLNDPEMLARGLGLSGLQELREFLKLENIRKARDKIWESIQGKERARGATSAETWLNLSRDAVLELEVAEGVINKLRLSDVFDEQGRPRLGTDDEIRKFIEFINFHTYYTPDERLEAVLKDMIAERAMELSGLLDKVKGVDMPHRKWFVQSIAEGMLYTFGTYILLDNTRSGRSEAGKLNYGYRMKKLRKYGAAGDPYNVPDWMNWLLPEDMQVTTVAGIEGKRKMIYTFIKDLQERKLAINLETKAIAERYLRGGYLGKQIEKRVREIQELGGMSGKGRDEIIKQAEKEILAETRTFILQTSRKDLLDEYDSMVAQWNFESNVEHTFQVDSEDRSFKLDDYISGPERLSIEKYTKPGSILGEGPTIDMIEYQKEYSAIALAVTKLVEGVADFGATRRVWDDKLRKVREMTVAEYMFGESIFNFPMFLTNGKFDIKKFNDNRGMVITDKGKKRVITNKRELTVSVILGSLIRAQIMEFRQYSDWNKMPRASFGILDSYLVAFKNLPAGFFWRPGDARSLQATGNFFSDEVYKWILKETGNRLFERYGVEFLGNFFFGTPGKEDGLWYALGETAKEVFEASIKGVQQ